MGCCISSTFNHHQYRLNPFNNFHFEFILKLSKLCFGFEVDKSNYFEDLWDKKNLKIFSSRNSSRNLNFFPFLIDLQFLPLSELSKEQSRVAEYFSVIIASHDEFFMLIFINLGAGRGK